jgi:hypothetical protein
MPPSQFPSGPTSNQGWWAESSGSGTVGCFTRALHALMQMYSRSDLFRLVTYDAGACSKDNAQAVREHGLHYLFGLKATQPTLYEEAARWLGSRLPEQADATTSDVHGDKTIVRRLYIGDATASPEGWKHLRTVLRVTTTIATSSRACRAVV